jgi:hypothetical protein
MPYSCRYGARCRSYRILRFPRHHPHGVLKVVPTTANMEQQQLHETQSVRVEATHPNMVAPKVPETTHEPTFLSRASSMTAREPVVRTLHTSLWPLVVFIFYATISAFTWAVFCIASSRPFGSKQDYTNQKGYGSELDAVLTKHEKAIRAAQILQAVVALLTIPVTSAICSMALAAFVQTSRARTKLNLRQTMALADQGWINPRIWTMCSKVGSLPLYIAFSLTLVGRCCTDVSGKPVLTQI